MDKFESLKRLKELLDNGILTQEEYEKAKAQLLENDNDIPGLSEEQKAQLKRIEALKSAGILNDEEYAREKRRILSKNQTGTHTSSGNAYSNNSNQRASSVVQEPVAKQKKKHTALWIILGLVACIIIVAIIADNSSGGYYGSDSFYGNSYSAIDNYLEHYDNVYREGNTVYYCDYEDIPAQGIVGGILRNPNMLSFLGEEVTDLAGMFSGSVREGMLNYLVREEHTLLQKIVSSNLNLSYMLNGTQVFVYPPEEISMKM